ncbi:MAG: hypothetical protein EPO68_01560 [Planctomycetota bacterium]|nr:MAG: hypothetical protein EPO68_01560 [Planctomycetota bacterium]
MKLLISLAVGLLGIALFATAAPTTTTLPQSEVAAIVTGGDIDPVPVYWKCTPNAGNCQDCVAGTKCSKNLQLRLCKRVVTVSECAQTVATNCGQMTKYANLDCTGPATIGGTCFEATCP